MTMNINKIYAMKFDETITHLKTMLPAADFIVTGSYVLAKYGLMPWDKVFDLDIILVKPEIPALHVMNSYMKTFPASSTAKLKTTVLPIPEVEERPSPVKKEAKPRPDDEDDEDVKPAPKFGKVQAMSKSALQAIFKFEDTKIDIFIEDNFNEPTLLIDDIKHTTVPHILAAKKIYGRMKDWMQCREMSRVFYKEEEFQTAINNDWRKMLKSEY
jgi:hypothetical protein